MAKTPRIIPPLTAKDLERFWDHVDKTPGLGPHGDCWLWRKSSSERYYGSFKFQGIEYSAHRIACFLTFGDFTQEFPLACHTCDTPRCVRHVYPGSYQDNMNDKVSRNRHAHGVAHAEKVKAATPRGDDHYARTEPWRLRRGDNHYSRLAPEKLARGDRNGSRAKPERLKRGSAHPQAILTEADVIEIRARRDRGATLKDIMPQFPQIGRSGLEAIFNNRTWKHLIPSPPDSSDERTDAAAS